MIDIQPATHVSDDTLREAMQSAFSDYAVPLRLDADAFAFMMRQRGLDRSSSRIAIQAGQVVAIWLIAVRGSQAYLISSGTIPEARSQGIARALALDCLDGLRDRGAESFQTEVLKSNKTAANLYRSLGMKVSRDLACYLLEPKNAAVSAPLVIKTVHWKDIAASAASLRDWQPSWQNDDLAVLAISDDAICASTFDPSGLSGYIVADPNSGTVFQFAVRPDLRRNGVGTALLKHVAANLRTNALRVLNVQESDKGFGAFVTANGAVETEGQHELAMSL